jgi:hypothetical protein
MESRPGGEIVNRRAVIQSGVAMQEEGRGVQTNGEAVRIGKQLLDAGYGKS